MIKIKSLSYVYTCFIFINFVVLLFILNIWYISPGHDTKRSLGIQKLSESIHQRNILGHLTGPAELNKINSLKNAVMNNASKTSLAPRPSSSSQTDHPGSYSPILNIFNKALFSAKSSKRLAIKSKRLDRIYDVWNVTFNSSARECHSQDEVVAVVNSAPANYAARMAIRSTWGKSFLASKNMRIVFFVGQTQNSSVQQSVDSEEALTGDIVRADFHEDYRNLTLKSVLLLRWVSLRCPLARFVVKVDDDVFVNVANLLEVLEQRKASKATIFGKLARGWTPVRNPESHYFVEESSWAASVYPDFVAGPAYVMSGDVVPLLLLQVPYLPYFFLEDVYVTGMCAQKAGVARVHQEGFRALAKPLNPCSYHELVTAHGLGPKEMTKIFDLLTMYSTESEECWEEKCAWNWFGVCMETKRTLVDFEMMPG